MRPEDLTYAAPCTACGEDGHARPDCPYGVPRVVEFVEMANPAAIGWRFSTTYSDDDRVPPSTWELVADPATGRLLTCARQRPDGGWAPMGWRGHQPPDLAGARAYALAYAHGAEMPDAARNPDCGCRECRGGDQ